MAGGLFRGGDGTEGNPFLVEDADDLTAVRNGLDKYYKQISDINLSGFNNWVPIGDSSTYFSGQYDGNNLKISNLNTSSGNDDVGLFGRISLGAKIKSLTLDTPNITGGNNVGGIVGSIPAKASSTSDCIVNCAVINGSITGVNNVGGLLGYVNSTSMGFKILSNCFNSGCNVTGENRVGGLLGYSYGYIYSVYNSYSANNIIAGTSNVGGLVGNFSNYNSSSFDGLINSYCLCNTIKRLLGTSISFHRLVGYRSSTSIRIVDCYSRSDTIFESL